MSNINENWGAEPWRRPAIGKDDVLLYSEHGRIVQKGTYGHVDNAIDYRSHWFCIIRPEFGPCFLVVKHGGGEERFELLYRTAEVHLFFERLDSTERYLLMHTLYRVHNNATQQANEKTRHKYEQAFLTKRLKKRKMPKSDRYTVWIDPAPAKVPCT